MGVYCGGTSTYSYIGRANDFSFRDRKYCTFNIPGSSLDTMEMRILLTGQEVRSFFNYVVGLSDELTLATGETKNFVFAVNEKFAKIQYWRKLRNVDFPKRYYKNAELVTNMSNKENI